MGLSEKGEVPKGVQNWLESGKKMKTQVAMDGSGVRVPKYTEVFMD